MKRGILFGLFSIMFLGVVSAQDIGYGMSNFINAFSSVLGFLFGRVDGNNPEILIVKFLVFLLLFLVVRFSLNRVPGFRDNTSLSLMVALIVAFIAVRYLTTDELVNFIWLPYGVLGIVLSSIFPLIIFFYFIEYSVDSALIRKIGWAFFIAVYLGLAIYRWDSLSVGEEWWNNLGMWYFIVAVVSLIILIFEKSIRVSMLVSMIRRGEDTHGLVLKGELHEELRKINNTLANSHLTSSEVKKLKDEKKRIEKAIARFS